MAALVLVAFNWTRDKDPRVPLGHASLLAAARSGGLTVRPLVYPVNGDRPDPPTLAREIIEAAGDDAAVAFGAYIWGEALLQAVLRAVRAQGFTGRLIVGGPQISYSGPGLPALYPGVDAFIRGYAEAALVQAVQCPRGAPIPGVVWAGGPERQQQARVTLGALPSPYQGGQIDLADQRFVRWETQRGCPFRCSFCQHREAGARLRTRALDPGRVAAEIDLFCAAGVDDIAVLDPIFNAGGDAVAILERFADRGFEGRLSLQCRAELLDAAFLDAASRLDVRLELGLQTIHPAEGAAIKRRNHLPKVDAALAEVRRRGIDHEVSLIFGLPLQTLASFEASVAWCLDRAVPVIKAFPLMLLRGTALEQDRARWGLLTDDDDAMPLVRASSTFSADEWDQMAQLSDALRQTEGRHGPDVAGLRRAHRGGQPAMGRWQPGVAA